MDSATASPLRLVSDPRRGAGPASFWRFEGSPAPGTGRTPILAIAGLGLDGRVFSRLGGLARDRDLVLVNLRNDRPGAASMADFGREALDALDAAGHGDRPAVLLGSSFGAMVALAAALERPARVAALVLVGAGPGWSSVPLRLRAASRAHPFIPRAAYPSVFASIMLPPGRRMRPEVRRDLRTQMLHRTKGYLGASLDAMRAFDARPRIREIPVPALVIHGDRDPVIPIRGGEWLAGALPRATLVRFPGSGHLPHVARPAETVAAVAEFLGREGL